MTDFHNGDLGIVLKETQKPDPFPQVPFKNPPISPLVLDLDGNGIALTSTASGTHFDFAGDHYRELTGWVDPGDGLLVYDANHDGQINDGTELFGNATTDGFDVLSFYDGRTGGNYYTDHSGGSINSANVNGAIDASDAIYSQLQVWRDLNQDGLAQANELTSLAAEGITRINLNHVAPDTSTQTGAELVGNSISQVATFERQDGSTSTIGDAWFAVDSGDTIYNGPAAAGMDHWPDLHGYGNLDQLSNVLARNAGLKGEFREFIDRIQTQDVASLIPQFEQLLYKWAGVPEDYSVDRGEFINGRMLAFLEVAYGDQYHQLEGWNAGTNSPGPVAAGTLTAIYNNAIASYFVKFLTQVPEFATTIGDSNGTAYNSKYAVLADALHYDPVDDTLSFDPRALVTALASTNLADPANVQSVREIFGLLTVVEAYQLKSNEQFYGELRDAILSVGAAQLLPLVDSLRFYDSFQDVTRSLDNGVYDYSVRSFNFDLSGNYTVVQPGAFVSHRASADLSSTTDLFYIQPGLGTVTFAPERDPRSAVTVQDRIVLSSEFSGAEYTVERDASTGEVRISFAALGTVLVLQSYLDTADHDAPQSDRDAFTGEQGLSGATIYFADGTVLQPADVAALLVTRTTEGGDTVNGLWLNETIDGKGGDDVISGGGGSDVIIGGKGNDVLSGNGPGGTYVFAAGDGNDSISDSQGSTLQLNGIVPADIRLARGGTGNNDLLITFPGHPNDSINIRNEFGSPSIAKIVFGDGTSWGFEDIQTRLILQNASDGNDVIVGFDGSDVLAGGKGDDILQGGPSAFGAGDTYLYSAGDGNDTIIPCSINVVDTLNLIGIRSDQVVVTRNGADVVLSFLIPEGGSVTLQDQLGQYGFHGLERVLFADGVVWTQRDFIVHTEAPIDTPTVVGTVAGEVLAGTDGADGLAGLGGDDILRGGAGSDTYFFGVGSGHDVIEDNGAGDYREVDTVKLSLLPSDVELTRGTTDVVIKIVATGETLTLANFFYGDVGNDHRAGSSIERLQFSDGTVWDVPQIIASAWIRGTDGNDIINGTSDDDTIFGGLGNDQLVGGRGSDTYIIAAGGGRDNITEYTTGIDPNNPGVNDVVKFVDSTIHDVLFRMSRDPVSNHLSLSIERIDGSAAAVFDLFWPSGVETLQFSDGSALSFQDALSRAKYYGTDAGEIIGASQANDTIIGGKGDDVLYGDLGSDRYEWARGDGNDIINEFPRSQDEDVLHLSGIDPSLVRLERVSQPNGFDNPFYDLQIHVLPFQASDAFETITVTHEFDSNLAWAGSGVEFIEFDDGTVWDRAQMAAHSPLRGTAGADTVVGSEFSDTITGGFGDDDLYGGVGSDTYVWTAGDGNDRITDGNPGDIDTLRLHGVDPASVQVVPNNQFESPDLLIVVGETGETIRLSHQAASSGTAIERIVFDNGDVWDVAEIARRGAPAAPIDGTDGDDILSGTARADEINGLAGNDVILGAGGDDVISGGDGDDVITGGRGADNLDGGSGNDTYIWTRGDGNDSIGVDRSAGDFDVLRLRDVDPATVQLTLDYSHGTPDLLLLVAETGEQIRLSYQAYDAMGGVQAVDQIVFDNGDAWDAIEIARRAGLGIFGSAGDDTVTGDERGNDLYGLAGNDTIGGLGGNDRIYGGIGDDLIVGGSGDDFLDGGTGNDTYDWAVGDGYDTIGADPSAGFDVLRLRGVDPTTIQLIRDDHYQANASDLLLVVAETGEEIRLSGQVDSDSAVDRIVFDNGDVWDSAEIARRAGLGTSGDDRLEGDDSGNLLNGRDGNDVIFGRGGNDVIRGGAGDDVIDGGPGDDDLDGQEGFDRITYESAVAGVQVNLNVTGAQDTVGAGIDTLTGFEALTGSNFDDRLGGNAGDNTITGLLGADRFVFTGTFGQDTVTDFASGEDSLELDENIFADLAAVFAAASQVGSDVRISAGAYGAITLSGISLADLMRSEIMIVPAVLDAPDIVKPATTSNTSRETALQLTPSAFDTARNDEIESSTTIPHATIQATANGSGREYYSLTVQAGDRVIFDIDHGFDTVIQIIDSAGNILDENDDNFSDPGSTQFNSLLDETFSQPGTYYLVVGEYSGDSGGVAPRPGETYTLNVSVQHQSTNEGNHVPTISSATVIADHGVSIDASAMFRVSDVDGNPIQAYQLFDASVDGSSGHWVVDGVAAAANVTINVSADQLPYASFLTGYGTDNLYVRASDGTSWSAWTPFQVTVPADQTSIPASQPDGPTFIWVGSASHATLIGNDYGFNIFRMGAGAETADGGAGRNAFQISQTSGQSTIKLSTTTGSENEIEFLAGITDQNLWFEQSGNDLKIDLFGTTNTTLVKDWFSGTSAQVQEITAGGLKIDSQVSQLVQAMAAYSANHTGFDPAGFDMQTVPNDPALQNVMAVAWHA